MTHTVRANMAGTVLDVLVKPGDRVSEGQDVVMIESMKMHLPMPSDRGGVVKAVRVKSGDFVNEGDAVLELDA
jgi:acetyl-CoA carboxylase biotin carboxyl carrier protein